MNSYDVPFNVYMLYSVIFGTEWKPLIDLFFAPPQRCMPRLPGPARLGLGVQKPWAGLVNHQLRMTNQPGHLGIECEKSCSCLVFLFHEAMQHVPMSIDDEPPSLQPIQHCFTGHPASADALGSLRFPLLQAVIVSKSLFLRFTKFGSRFCFHLMGDLQTISLGSFSELSPSSSIFVPELRLKFTFVQMP